MPNQHPLVADFQMYYRGCYVCRAVPDGYDTMYVEAITADGDEREIANIRFVGHVFRCGASGPEEELHTWRGDEIEVRIPRHGYYSLPGSTVPVYLSYVAQNRTNRRGLDPRTILINGRTKGDLRHRSINILFNQCLFPGQFSRDLCVYNNNLLWKGMEVGTLVNGNVTIQTKYEKAKELICEQLGRSLTVRQVTVE